MTSIYTTEIWRLKGTAMTPQELQQYDGREGRKAYVAYHTAKLQQTFNDLK